MQVIDQLFSNVATMKVSNLKLLTIRLILADVSKSELSKQLGVDPAILSRDIKNRELISKIDDFFNKIDPEINILSNRLIKDSSVVEDPASSFGDKKALLELIKTQNEHIDTWKRIEEVLNQQISEKNKRIDWLEKELEQLDVENEKLKTQHEHEPAHADLAELSKRMEKSEKAIELLLGLVAIDAEKLRVLIAEKSGEKKGV